MQTAETEMAKSKEVLEQIWTKVAADTLLEVLIQMPANYYCLRLIGELSGSFNSLGTPTM